MVAFVGRRDRFYAGLCGALFLAAVVLGLANGRHHGAAFTLVESDGRFYYAYLPAVLLDGGLDFDDQIRDHWDIDYDPALLANRTDTGRVRNKYTVGMALTLAPAFLAGHAAALLTGGRVAADGYSWPYQIACLAWVHVLGWLTLRRIDRVATDGLGVPPAAALRGIAVVAFATPYAYYFAREPFMVHAVSTFWCTEAVAAALVPARRAAAAWPRLAFATAMAVVCRPTNLFLLPVVALGAIRRVRADGGPATLRRCRWPASPWSRSASRCSPGGPSKGVGSATATRGKGFRGPARPWRRRSFPAGTACSSGRRSCCSRWRAWPGGSGSRRSAAGARGGGAVVRQQRLALLVVRRRLRVRAFVEPTGLFGVGLRSGSTRSGTARGWRRPWRPRPCSATSP